VIGDERLACWETFQTRFWLVVKTSKPTILMIIERRSGLEEIEEEKSL
jgi:hypothetical protein